MKAMRFCLPLSVAIFGFSMSSSVHAGVATEVIEQTGKAIARAVTGEAVETGAKAAAKQALNKATQEAAEAGAKRAASRAATVVDDIVAKGGIGDNVADFAWRNKGVIAGGAAVATLVANPETTLASGASMFNASVDATAQHVVGPAVSNLSGTIYGVLGVWIIGGLAAVVCWAVMNKEKFVFALKLYRGMWKVDSHRAQKISPQ